VLLLFDGCIHQGGISPASTATLRVDGVTSHIYHALALSVVSHYRSDHQFHLLAKGLQHFLRDFVSLLSTVEGSGRKRLQGR